MATPKRNLNKEIIALFSGQASIVSTPKLYIELTGSHSLALVLNQCVYWSNKSECENGWFHKEYEEWFEEIHIPERTLRRRFDRLENSGWITTKVKKVRGVNTKHIQPHMDKIIESISIMLNMDCPNRPDCLDRIKNEQKPCTKVAPIGHFGRLESATLAVSRARVPYIADNYNQIKTTNCQVSSSFFFSETLDQNLLSQKLHRDERSDEEFMEHVIDHVENHSDKQYSQIVRAQGALKLLTKLKKEGVLFYAKGRQPKEIKKPSASKPKENMLFTPDELNLINEYNAAMKYHTVDPNRINLFLSKELQTKAQELILRGNAVQAKESQPCQRPSPSKNVRANSLKSVSSLVSHLPLSQQDS